MKWNGSIKYYFTINNAKVLVSNDFIFMTNGEKQSFGIETYYINDVEIDNRCMKLKLENNLTIKFDY